MKQDSALKLHERVAEKLVREYVEAGLTYLPPIAELASICRVSSTTVGKALSLLRSKGLLEYSRGKRVAVSAQIPRTGPMPESSVQKLLLELRGEILDGSFKAGQMLPKFEFLAKTKRISRDTVAEVFRQLCRERLVSKRGRSWYVGKAIELAAKLAQQSSPSVSSNTPVVLIFTSNFFQWSSMCIAERYRPFTDSFYHELEHYGIQTRIVLPDLGASKSIFSSGRDAIRELIHSLGNRYAGTLIACKKNEVAEIAQWISWFTHFKRPVVWLDANDEGDAVSRSAVGDSKFYFRCRFNESAGVAIAIQVLTDVGHKEIGIPNFRAEYEAWVEHRIGLFRRLCKQLKNAPAIIANNCPDDKMGPDTTVQSESAAPFELVDFDRFRKIIQLRGSYLSFIKFPLVHCARVLGPLLERKRLSAIVAPNDFLAIEYFFWLSEQGIAIPGDLSLLSFDNCEESRPFPISTIDFGFGHLGYCSAHLFMGDIPIRADDGGTISAKCSLINRGSIGRPRR